MTTKPGKPSARIARYETELATHAASFPDVHEDAPWGHRAFKVRGKTFLFMDSGGDGLGLSTKLPHTGALALNLPFAEPTHYGLGKSGWVSAQFAPGDDVPVALLREWIDESYRAIAPKKLVATLGTPKPARVDTKSKPSAKSSKPKTKRSATSRSVRTRSRTHAKKA